MSVHQLRLYSLVFIELLNLLCLKF